VSRMRSMDLSYRAKAERNRGLPANGSLLWDFMIQPYHSHYHSMRRLTYVSNTHSLPAPSMTNHESRNGTGIA
jgi:hypothetical protein